MAQAKISKFGSAPKVKVDKFGDDKFKEMYSLYASADFNTFQQWCIKAIQENSVSSNLKKQEFSNSIKQCHTKDRAVKKMTDFFLAGSGHKVYKVA